MREWDDRCWLGLGQRRNDWAFVGPTTRPVNHKGMAHNDYFDY